MLGYAAPVYLGWSLGANDASNIFGTAVASRMVRFLTAALLGALFVMLGAVLEGEAGMRTLGGLSDLDLSAAGIVAFGAAIAVTLLTILRLPVSTSQAVVGAILGVGLSRGGLRTAGLTKIVICWIGTPVGALLIAVAAYLLLAPLYNRMAHKLVSSDILLRAGLILVGCYGAYALGANNVANVTGIFVGAGALTPLQGALLGGASIGLGILTFSRRVMRTVGSGIVRLNGFSALVVSLATALTVHLYALIGVPVSSSQAVVGAVLGVGLLKSAETLRLRALLGILSGWLATPVLAGLASAALYVAAHLEFTG